MKSPFDSDGKSHEYGMSVEQLFKEMGPKYHFEIKEANREQNMFSHIDFFITGPDGRCQSVDVKAMKKLNRYDDNTQDEWLFLEFKNVNGYPGWLYGKADLIAFERQTGFTFIRRKVLAETAERLIDFNTKVTRSSDAKYKTYTRNNRKDLVGMIKFTDLPKDKIKSWSK